jgi:hypothetical protein
MDLRVALMRGSWSQTVSATSTNNNDPYSKGCGSSLVDNHSQLARHFCPRFYECERPTLTRTQSSKLSL